LQHVYLDLRPVTRNDFTAEMVDIGIELIERPSMLSAGIPRWSRFGIVGLVTFMRRVRKWLKWRKAQFKAFWTGIKYLQHPYNRIRFGCRDSRPASLQELREAERRSEIAELEYLFELEETRR
jgi:hypothetical protein